MSERHVIELLPSRKRSRHKSEAMSHPFKITILILVAYLVRLEIAYSEVTEVGGLFLSAEAGFKNLPSFEFSYQYTFEFRREGSRPTRHGHSGKIRCAGAHFWLQRKFYSVSNFTGSTNYTEAYHYAFDGSLYQSLTVNSLGQGVLCVTRNGERMRKEPSNYLPIVVPYFFAVDEVGSFLRLEEFGRSDVWREVTKNAHVIGEAKIGSTKTIVVEIKKGASTSYILSLARDLDFYPLQWRIRGKKQNVDEIEGRVEKYEMRKYSSGRIVIPLVIRIADLGNDDTAKYEETYMIDENTLRVGEAIPEESFRISAAKGFSIVDLDSNVEIRGPNRGPSGSAHPLPRQ